MKNKQLKYFFLFFTIAVIFHQKCLAQVDTSFWFVAPEVTVGHVDRPIYLRLTSFDHSATATISFPARPWITPITQFIAAYSSVSINMTAYIDSLENKPANTILRYGVHITSNSTITAYYEVAGTNNPEIYTLKGAQGLGLDFYIPTQNQYPNESSLSPAAYNSFNIVATQNNTLVTITPSHAIVGHAAGVPFTITLNKGQTYAAIATSQLGANHLYGSHVTSNKPIAITVSDDSVRPTGYGCYDLQGDQIVPISVLGTDYVAVKGSLSFNDWIFVIGAYPNTNIYFNGSGTSSATIGAGGVFAYQFANPILYIKTSQPAYVWHESGFGCEMGATLLPSILCTGSNTVSITRTTNEYFGVNLITSNAAKGGFQLNGVGGVINGSAFSAVPGTANAYWAARIDLSSSTTVGAANTITNTMGLFHAGVIHGGSSSGCRYGYFSGYSNLYLGPDALICSADTLSLDAGDFKDSYHWNTGDTIRKIKAWYTDTFWVVSTMNTCTLTDTIIVRALPSPDAVFTITSDTAQCFRGNRFTFLNSSTISSGSSTLSHLWKFGDNTTSTSVNPSHIYGSPGSYTIKLYVTSLDGCVDSLLRHVTVYPRPAALFTVNDSTQCFSGNNFIMTNNSTISSGTATYLWNFADGNTSTTTSPTHQYLSFNTFRISLVATSNKGCRDTAKKNLFVYPMPVAQFSVNDLTQCQRGNRFIFSNTSSIASGSLSYHWDFGDDSISILLNPIHTYVNPDTFDISLITNSAMGCSDTSEVKSYVFSTPKSRFILNDSTQCLSDNFVGFTNQSSIFAGNLSYTWYFGDGDTSHVINPNHIYRSFNTFLVKLSAVSNTGCTDSMTRRVLIYPMPDASFTINDSSQCLRGNNFVFTNLSTIPSGAIFNYWTFGDFNISLIRNTSHSYTTNDTFQVKLAAISAYGCKDTMMKDVIVFPQPKASFSINDTGQCLSGNNFLLNNKSNIASGGFLNSWNYGDNHFSNDTNSAHSYLNDDTFSIRLKVISPFGCSDSQRKDVVVYPMPKPLFTINDSVQCFKGNRFILTNNSVIHSGNMMHSWYFSDKITDFNSNTTHVFTYDDTFFIRLKSKSGFGCEDSITKKVYVFPSPNVKFLVNDSSQCMSNNRFNFTNQSTINTGTQAFDWNFGDGSKSALKNPFHVYLNPDTFLVKLIALSDLLCADSAEKNMLVYPMPVPGFWMNDSVQCFKGNNFVFNNSSSISSGSINYLWKFSNQGSSLLKNPVFSFNTDYDYPVTMIAQSSFGCIDSITKIARVNPSPIAAFTINDSAQCLLNNRLVFKNKTTIHWGNMVFNWVLGDGATSTARDSIIHFYMNYDTFTVKINAVSVLGCKDSLNRQLIIFPMPKASFSVNDSSQCESGNNFVFANLTKIPYGSLSYYWIFNDGNSSVAVNPIHSYNIYGNYMVQLAVSSGNACRDTIRMPVSVFAMPDARFVHSLACLEDSMNFSNTSIITLPEKINRWQWDFADGNTSVFENPSHVYMAPALYPVSLKVISENQCADSVIKQVRVNQHVVATLVNRATVEGDKDIRLEWEESTVGIPDRYVVERSPDEAIYSPVKIIKWGKTDYTDPDMDVKNHSFSYRVRVIDSCDFESPYSNIGKTILLVPERNTLHPVLHWTAYKDWATGVQMYDVQVKNTKLNQFNSVGTVSGNDTFFVDNITHLNQAEYCYRVIGTRADGTQSYSNVACVPTPFKIWIPNAFTPGNDELNNRFEVQGTYIMEFSVMIFNRWGEKIYQSNNIDEGWDGTCKGQLCPAGYYYYRINARGTAGQGENADGMVMLIR